MLEAGWLDEVRTLGARGYPDDAPVWRTLGYPELRAVVAGTAPLAEAQAATVLATRRFARRQRTWFRGEPAVVWRDPETDRARLLDEAAAFLAAGVRPVP
jgi:tRNA dimethylallyltransferase